MNIDESHIANRYALEQVATYLTVENQVLQAFYNELIADNDFLNEINARIIFFSERKLFTKGLFGKGAVDSVDWFGFQRILLYVLVRLNKPDYCLETGVYYGGNTAFILNALHKNQKGTLISIDFPDFQIREGNSADNRHPWVADSELYSPSIQPGFMVPEYLESHWELKIGSSLDVIPTLQQQFQLYIHDSDHAYKFVIDEVNLALKLLSDDGLIIVDDIDWSNSFFHLCCKNEWFPMLVPDNGKDGVRVRTGLVKRNHEMTFQPGITRP